ncbi:MAG TPA: S41 family peptidase [bacterium]|nr:S41 family peptidase [bacterium]
MGRRLPAALVTLVVILAVATIHPAATPSVLAQSAPAHSPAASGLQLFSQIFRLITEEAYTPPPYQLLLKAAGEGAQLVLRGAGIEFSTNGFSGNERTDLQTFLTRLQQAMDRVPATLPPAEVVYAATKAMVQAVGDRNTVFLTPPEQARLNQQQAEPQPFVGIGVQLIEQSGHVVIVGVLESSPAAAGGVLPGDVITTVDGASVEGRSIADVRQLIAGEEGTFVTLGLTRPQTGEHLTATIVRARIVQPTASGRMLTPTIGYLRLTQFRQGSADQIAGLLRQLQSEGARGIVLDLRNNPGGYLVESVDIASHFLREGLVTTVRRPRGRSTTYLVRPREPKFVENLVVLLNGRSASASEVVAGALQDAGVKIIGETSYGKASVQVVYEFNDGSGLRLTIARYLTRGGRDIDGAGLTPDIAVPIGLAVVGAAGDAQLQRAIATLSEYLQLSSLATGH